MHESLEMPKLVSLSNCSCALLSRLSTHPPLSQARGEAVGVLCCCSEGSHSNHNLVQFWSVNVVAALSAKAFWDVQMHVK